MFYVCEEYKPWEQVEAKTLRGAKIAATKRASFKGTKVAIAVKVADDFVCIWEKKNGKPWRPFVFM